MEITRKESVLRDLDVFRQLSEELLDQEENVPVSPYLSSGEMREKIDFGLSSNGMMDQELTDHLRKLVKHTPKTASNHFFNQLFGGRHSKSMLGELLAVLLNNSMYTYKAGGPHILLEQSMLQELSLHLGYDSNAGGTMAPGGSMTNLMGMIMARDAKDQNVRNSGVSGRMTLYTSRESHYSIPKNASFIGVGRDHMRYVNTDENGAMDVTHLRALIEDDLQKGFMPFMINATAGTTVLGAFDPIDAIADLAHEYDLWLHVDGAYCGSVIFSEKYKSLIAGAEKADSFTLNAHKMLGTQLSTSFILVKDKKKLYKSFSNDASYLFQTHEDDLNPGKVSLQCGRRNDALKFWTLWKAIGTDGLRDLVEHQFYLADVARDYINSHSDYTLYSRENSVSVCFNYKGLSPIDICNGLYLDSEMMIGYGSFREDTFIRLVTINSGNTEEDILRFFKKVESYAEAKLNLEVELSS